jgi:hypothetical protein
MQIFWFSVAVVTLIVIAVNASFMLFSPKAWFRLPGWIRLNGTLTEKRYGSGAGSIDVRVLGAIFLIVVGWMFKRMIIGH